MRVKEASVPSKYDPLHKYLTAQSGADEVSLTFRQVEVILGFPLPDSARRHRPWWANETPSETRHTHSLAWTTAGWDATPNLSAGTVCFSKKSTRRPAQSGG